MPGPGAVFMDNYHAYGDGRELALTRGENNRIRVQVPAGFSGKILIRYQVPPAWRFSEAVSCMTVCVMVWVCVRNKKERRNKRAGFIIRSITGNK